MFSSQFGSATSALIEHLDPSDEPKEWKNLSEHSKECYAACIIAIVAAIGDQLANRCPTTT
jgi:hypothetical protein